MVAQGGVQRGDSCEILLMELGKKVRKFVGSVMDMFFLVSSLSGCGEGDGAGQVAMKNKRRVALRFAQTGLCSETILIRRKSGAFYREGAAKTSAY
jgi:hypothetical protein